MPGRDHELSTGGATWLVLVAVGALAALGEVEGRFRLALDGLGVGGLGVGVGVVGVSASAAVGVHDGRLVVLGQVRGRDLCGLVLVVIKHRVVTYRRHPYIQLENNPNT